MMISSSNSNQPGLIAGLKLYISRQASNLSRYLLEQFLAGQTIIAERPVYA